MEQERRTRLHGVLVVAKARQAHVDEIAQCAQSILAADRPAEVFNPPKVITEVSPDQRYHRPRGLVGRKPEPLGRAG